MNSTHSALPRRLNAAYVDFDGQPAVSGALLHTKFLNSAVETARLDQDRGQHFTDPTKFRAYYDALSGDPDLWHPNAKRYTGPEQLEELGLIHSGDWA